MTRAGKTFYFATMWLQPQVRTDAAAAYNFCRAIDDIADQQPSDPNRDENLKRISEAVLRGDLREPLVSPLRSILARFPEVRYPLADLVDACRLDTKDLKIDNERDLISYAHGVAGNVGLVMYPILGGVARQGHGPAADLGIAMQCTNIARDVIEDLGRGRVYIPTQWLKGCDPRAHLHGDLRSESAVVDSVRMLLSLAEKRYNRARSGIEYLAPQNRFAIKVAARCYAAIGERVIINGRLSQKRAVVPWYRKVILTSQMKLSESITGRRVPQQTT
jgi:phytoene synthase